MANGPLRALTRLGVLAVAIACVAVAVPGSRADEPSALRSAARGLASAEREALLRLYAAESASARARERVDALTERVETIGVQLRESRRYQAIARASLAASQARVARVLRLLYMEGPPGDALALILGAQSLTEVLDVVDSLRYATIQNRDLAVEAAARETALRGATTRLRGQASALRASRAAAQAAAREAGHVAADRARYLASLRERRRLTERRLAAVQARAEAAARRAARLQREAIRRRPAAPAATPSAAGEVEVEQLEEADPVAEEGSAVPETAAPSPGAASISAAGTRTLVVASTAYTLSGTTASGLPVGPGIIAVDPLVIPLGTRVYVPGYGEAVAADTGGAVQGAVIDVWLPSRRQALAWGTRTVTITIYRS